MVFFWPLTMCCWRMPSNCHVTHSETDVLRHKEVHALDEVSNLKSQGSVSKSHPSPSRCPPPPPAAPGPHLSPSEHSGKSATATIRRVCLHPGWLVGFTALQPCTVCEQSGEPPLCLLLGCLPARQVLQLRQARQEWAGSETASLLLSSRGSKSADGGPKAEDSTAAVLSATFFVNDPSPQRNP